MADTYASRTFVDTKRGRGKVILSEGVAPAEKILPDVGLATLLEDPEYGQHFELIILKGTIVTTYDKTYDNGDTGQVVTPCIGLTGCVLKDGVYDTVAGTMTYEDTPYTIAGDEAIVGTGFVPTLDAYDGTGVLTTAGQKAVPLGVCSIDQYRPFAYGENDGVSFITHGYVEWPLVQKIDDPGGADTVLFDNTDLMVGDYVKPDALGRPVKWNPNIDPDFLRVGRVVATETVGVDFDYGLLNYFTLPQDVFMNPLIRTPFESNTIDTSTPHAVTEIFGLQPNVDGFLTLVDPATAVAGATGAMRVQLCNL